MPNMDGFEVAAALRKRERTRHTAIVFISAYDQTVVQAKKGYVAGATDFIFSPVDEDLLKFKVATYVQIHLRNEALRLQIHQLQIAVREFEAKFNGSHPLDQSVQNGFRDLESRINEIQRQFEALPV